MDKKILYIDMDGVLVDFESGIATLDQFDLAEFNGRYDEVPGIFSRMVPMNGAIEAFEILAMQYDTYILSTAPWDNPSSGSDKLNWVKQYLGKSARKRLILSHHKHLNVGDFLIDDRLKNGVEQFQGEHIHFGTDKFPDWKSVLNYLEIS